VKLALRCPEANFWRKNRFKFGPETRKERAGWGLLDTRFVGALCKHAANQIFFGRQNAKRSTSSRG
jgi:hypothetical protein